MKVLITGGAGFIGSNLTDRFITNRHEVIVFDDLSRPGADKNLAWLKDRHGDGWRFIKGDVRDFPAFQRAASGVDVIFHLASQVAVTTSVQDPRHDFEVNALGTLNVLEAARLSTPKPVVVYASTNKVYGGMKDVSLLEHESGFTYRDFPFGISESQPLDFHSPYGCSKGTGDQYTRDYARIYGLPTVVLRQSCIYGPRQFGVEDQGWIAWFCIAVATGKPITIYGDGKQGRDVLWVDDLIDSYIAVVDHIDLAAGQVYNIGGGPDNVLSVWVDLGPMLEDLLGRRIDVTFQDWRPGDQRIFIADIRKAQKDLGWSPKVTKQEGVTRLFNWVAANKKLFVPAS